jgi:uncharacterized protein (DUF736 family)
MATIGNFQKTADRYTGTVNTLTLKAKISIVPVDKASDQAPDHRVFAGNAEIGAGWSARSKAGNDYMSLKLDDPSFPAPLYGRLVKSDDGTHAFVWNR